MALLPDEMTRALASFRECFQKAAEAGHVPINQKEVLRLFDWLADGVPATDASPTEGEETLAHARAVLQARLSEGLTCPCCGQFAKVYKRKLNSCMAQALVHIYQFFDVVEKDGDKDAWLHVPEFLVRTMGTASIAGGDVTKLRYWGLLESRPESRADGSTRQGFYRITPRGRAFVRNEVRVPKHVFLYNQECLAFSDELILITEALKEDFDYGELMRPS